MCVGIGNQRIAWDELHEARGFDMGFADGSGPFYDNSQRMPWPRWSSNNRHTKRSEFALIWASTQLCD